MKDKLKQFRQDCLQQNYPIMQDSALDFLIEQIPQNARVLELGSCVGYSSIYLALHRSDITITSIERDFERHIQARENTLLFQCANRITMIYDDALNYVPNSHYQVIIFDAAKGQNQAFFDRYYPYLEKQGKIIIDNMDFHGFKDKINASMGRNLKSMMHKLKDFEEFIYQLDYLSVQYYKIADGILVIENKYE